MLPFIENWPLQIYFPGSCSSNFPLKFLYHGYNGFGVFLFNNYRILCMISKGLYFRIFVDHPVPIPWTPFTKHIGIIGKYFSGSIILSPSKQYFRMGSSSYIKIYFII